MTLFAESFIIGLIIFSVSYIVIISEKINRAVVAVVGAVLMILFQVLSQSEALEKVDTNTLGLLVGMMVIVNVIKRTGFFEYVAIKTAKLAKGNPNTIIIYFAIISAVSSALLDNVTTILLVIPVTLVISDALKINPIPFFIAEILSANIGGAATLIGDPPNIMIGSVTGLGFLDFIINLLPLMIFIFIVTIVIIRFIYRKSFKVDKEDIAKILKMDPKKAIIDKKLMIKSLIILVLTIIGFTVAEIINVGTASIAVFGASFLILISRLEPDEILSEIEWQTIFFFGGLFILVGALEKIGFINILAENMLSITNGNIATTTLLVLWMSSILSSFLDNIPYVATMIPLVKTMSEISSGNFVPVWWALSIGACLGGNGTIIGASANVVARGALERRGFTISFFDFMKISFPLMILSIIISTVYLMLFYL